MVNTKWKCIIGNYKREYDSWNDGLHIWLKIKCDMWLMIMTI